MKDECQITLYVQWRDLVGTLCVIALLLGMMR